MSQQFICKDCNNPYTRSDEEIKIFSGIDKKTGQQMVLPKRCRKCRALKRQRNREADAHTDLGY
jgi:hypothetical protein